MTTPSCEQIHMPHGQWTHPLALECAVKRERRADTCSAVNPCIQGKFTVSACSLYEEHALPLAWQALHLQSDTFPESDDCTCSKQSICTHSPPPHLLPPFPTAYHRALDGLRCVIPDLSFVIVAPGEDVSGGGAHNAVQGPAGHVNYPLMSKRTHDALGRSLVAVITVSQAVVVSFTPVGGVSECPCSCHSAPFATGTPTHTGYTQTHNTYHV